MESLQIRRATPEDENSLWVALYYASHSDDDVEPADIRAKPDLERYVAGWGDHGDLGVIAESDGEMAGAAWVRLLPEAIRHEPTFVDPETPELAIAVLPKFQGRGIGTRMLEEIVAASRGRFPAIVLSVRVGNDAERLYRRFGFVEVGKIRNRVGAESYKMVLALD